MKIHFYLRYRTRPGESCLLCIEQNAPMLLEYLNEEFWHGSVETDAKKQPMLTYQYQFQATDGVATTEWESERRLDLKQLKSDSLQVIDTWNPASAAENAFYTKPFQSVFLKSAEKADLKIPATYTHTFRVKAPLLGEHESLCLLGHGKGLRSWDTAAPLLLIREGNWWTIRLDLSQEDFPLGYKYGVWNTQRHQFKGFEEGTNRTIYTFSPTLLGNVVVHDGFARFPANTWKGAGVAIPVFSLRTAQSFGVGEFTDLNALTDWSKSIGLKLLQLLPINDTTATHTWTDSYPYAPISVFALHPIYLNVSVVAGKKNAAAIKPLAKIQQALNALEVVDYAAVLQHKWDIIRQLYDLQKADWLKDAAYQQYFAENKHWLIPYAAFCFLRDMNGTADFNQWSEYAVYDAAAIEQLASPKSKQFDLLAIHLFVQWHLHGQLKSAVDYAHTRGLALKGDLPIGIYRYSADAWVAPDLYNMDKQAGAPPDDFAAKGQNWGFPTYNWARMKEDGFAWWKQRFEQMSLYFDAFRIDHILGFFRIWSIPLDAVEGILGRFIPAIPVTEQELNEKGIGFDYDRFCKPYITDRLVWEIFGQADHTVKGTFLLPRPDGRYDLRPEYATQRQLEAYFAFQEPSAENTLLQEGLFNLISNVIFLAEDVSAAPAKGGLKLHFRIGIDKTPSFKNLEAAVQERLNKLYLNYFYRRQDAFWEAEAMDKLPALKRSTNMLICGEDLGMVPDCVPGVMHRLGMLSLEIQRMPKAAGTAFFHPKDAPYLSVVTPGTHDMSTLRGWWEEDRSTTQRFFNEILQQPGVAPFFCEPWINKMMLEQHFYSPAMWTIFQLQDFMGIDANLRRSNPAEERINIPANPKHYWQYRMHLDFNTLSNATQFNAALRQMVVESGRL